MGHPLQRCSPLLCSPALMYCNPVDLGVHRLLTSSPKDLQGSPALPAMCGPVLCFCIQVQPSLSGSPLLSLLLGVLLSLSSPAWLCLLLDCPCRCWLGQRLLSLLVGLFLKSGLGVILLDSLDGGCMVPAPQLAVWKNRHEGRGSYPRSGASGGRALCVPFQGL